VTATKTLFFTSNWGTAIQKIPHRHGSF